MIVDLDQSADTLKGLYRDTLYKRECLEQYVKGAAEADEYTRLAEQAVRTLLRRQLALIEAVAVRLALDKANGS